MKLFIDTASLQDIEEIASWGVLAGVTTNPTLLSQVEGDEDSIYRRICELVDGPISAEVVANDVPTMISEGKRLAAIHPNIVVKLPTCAEGLSATSALAKDGIRVNMTLCFTASQAMLDDAAFKLDDWLASEIAAEFARCGHADQSVHIGAVHIHAGAVLVHQLAQFLDLGLEHAVGAGVGDHHRRQMIAVLLAFGAQVVEVDIAVAAAAGHHHRHAGHLRRCRVGAMG